MKKKTIYVQRGHYCNTYVYICMYVFFLKKSFSLFFILVPSSLTVCFPEEALKQHTNLLSWVKHNLSLISYFIPLLIPVLFTFNLVLITGSILPLSFCGVMYGVTVVMEGWMVSASVVSLVRVFLVGSGVVIIRCCHWKPHSSTSGVVWCRAVLLVSRRSKGEAIPGCRQGLGRHEYTCLSRSCY